MKKFIKRLLPAWLVDRIRRRLVSSRAKVRVEDRKSKPVLSLDQLQFFLESEMGLRAGDSLFIHSSFAELGMTCSPEDLIAMLQRLTGPSGNLLMPFYPIKGSYEWLVEGKTFDLRKHRTNMGALPTAFARMEGVRKSVHPTKSVAAWGKDRDFIISAHHTSPMPYGESSPYFRVTQLPHSKVIGLGVTAARLSCMHVSVDLNEDYPVQPYHPRMMSGKVINYEGKETDVATYAHDLTINEKEDVPRFLRETKCPTYKEYVSEGRIFFSVGAKDVVDHTAAEGRKGRTFFYPRSLNYKQPKREKA